jgi:hypothetical protein
MKHWKQTFATYVYNHCNICNIPIYFCNIHLKHLQHTSKTFKTYAYNMCFQQNMAARRAEHGTAESRLCGRGGEGGWQWPGGCAVPGDRAYAVPVVEATTAVAWCGLARRACCGGAGVAMVEMKAGRHGREGGVREPRWSRSWSGVMVIRDFF